MTTYACTCVYMITHAPDEPSSMAVKVRQAKDQHNTTRVIVSCNAACIYQCCAVKFVEHINTTKQMLGLLEEPTTSAASPGFGARRHDCTARNDCEALRPRPLADLWKANSAMAPKLFPYFFPEKSQRQHGYFNKIHSILKFHLPFPRRKLNIV